MRVNVKTFGTSFFLTVAMKLFFFPFGILKLFPETAFTINAGKCIVWAILLMGVVLLRRSISKFCRELHLFWLVFLLCIIVSDFRSVNFNTWLTVFCSTCGVALMAELWNIEYVIKVFYKYFSVLAILNLFFLIIRPEGFAYSLTSSDGLSTFTTSSNFLTTDNQYAPFVFCLLMLNEIQYNNRLIKKRTYYLIWIVALTSTGLIFSATCIMGVLVFILGKFATSINIKGIKFKVSHIVIAAILLFVGIYFFQIQKILSFFIEVLLGKDLSLTGRIGLWEMAIEKVKEKPLFGWGNYNQGSILLRNYYYWYAHNLFLDILLEGGIVLLIVFLHMISEYGKIIKGGITNKAVQYCIVAFAAFMVVNLSESFLNNTYFYIPMIISNRLINILGKGKYRIVLRHRWS